MTWRAIWTLGLALTMAPLAAAAGDYRVIGDSDVSLSIVETAIRTDAAGHRETVFVMVFAEPLSEPDRVQVLSAPLLLDCAGRRYRIGKTLTYRLDLTPVGDNEPRMAWRDLVPDSPFSQAEAFACRGQDLPRLDGQLPAIIAAWQARPTP